MSSPTIPSMGTSLAGLGGASALPRAPLQPGTPAAPGRAPFIPPRRPVKQIEREQEGTALKFMLDTFQFLQGQLREPHLLWVDGWKRYFTERPDLRDKVKERWRSHIVHPQFFYNTEALVAQLVEILFSVDPALQADPVFERSEETGRSMERLLDYTLRMNFARKLFALVCRDIAPQGISFIKASWAKKTVTVADYTNEKMMAEFEQALATAQEFLGSAQLPNPYEQPEQFELWRQAIGKANPNINIPQAPRLNGGTRQVLRFEGPVLELPNPWGIFYDPRIREMDDQPAVFHQTFKGKSWVEERTGEGPEKPFDPAAVADAMSGWGGEVASELQSEVASLLGIPSRNDQGNPQFEMPVEVLEFYRPNSTFPFQTWLNRKRIINKNCRSMPFEHGGIPITPVRHVIAQNFMIGVSQYRPAKTLLNEQDILRSLRSDKVLLHTVPVFKKLLGLGIPDLQRALAPGGIVEVSRMDGIAELFPGDINPSAFSETGAIGLDIDRAFGIGDNVRGATANVGRVSATDATQRLTQAITRIKLSAITVEDDTARLWQQVIGLWAQFGTIAQRGRAAGEPDPLKGLNRDELLNQMAADYRFRGPTQAAQRELQAQQLMTFMDKFGSLMTAKEKRGLMRTVAEILGLRSISKIITPEGDQLMVQMEQMQVQQQMAAGQQGTDQANAANAAASTPAQVPVQ